MIPSFSAWKAGLPIYGTLLILAAAGLTAGALGYRAGWCVGGALLLAGLFSFYFFRDPVRVVAAADNEIVSPADGTVAAIEDLVETPYYEGPCRRVSIFLSIFDVHVNRAPFACVVRDIQYRPGEFKNAMRPETTDCNEANTLWLDTQAGLMTVRQIAGLIARRIVCVAKPGEAMEKGLKFGMIRFGSRTELYLPPDTDVLVSLKQKVRAGSTVVARRSS